MERQFPIRVKVGRHTAGEVDYGGDPTRTNSTLEYNIKAIKLPVNIARNFIKQAKVSFEMGENVRVTEGPFANYAATVQDVKPDTLLDMPATFALEDGSFVAITEASLRRYAGMALMRSKESTELVCRLTPRADGTKVVRSLPLETPWRVVLVSDRAGAFLESSTLYCLNEPSVVKDLSWIKPGKLTFSWWNGNLYEAQPTERILSLSMNKKYIDFCAKSGIPYHGVIADETTTPWYKQTRQGVVPGPDTDVTKVRADLDLDGIRRYAASKGVKLWTWVHQAALRGRVEEAFAAFERFGWSGMMVDFFDHDDQDSVEHAEAILQAAARHHILIHFHGIWKPTGWQRTLCPQPWASTWACSFATSTSAAMISVTSADPTRS